MSETPRLRPALRNRPLPLQNTTIIRVFGGLMGLPLPIPLVVFPNRFRLPRLRTSCRAHHYFQRRRP